MDSAGQGEDRGNDLRQLYTYTKIGHLQDAGDEDDGEEDEEAEEEAAAPEQDELDKAIADTEPGAAVDDDAGDDDEDGSSDEGSVRQAAA